MSEKIGMALANKKYVKDISSQKIFLNDDIRTENVSDEIDYQDEVFCGSFL